MHLLEYPKFSPPFYYRNGHVHTIGAALFRNVPFSFPFRQRLELPDGDFLDLDWHTDKNDKCLVLIHGLEGSSQSSYIRSAASYFSKTGYDICAINLRSCSGEMNRLRRMYHHGEYGDLATVIQNIAPSYAAIFAIGFSLGGNQLLKYLSRNNHIPTNFEKGVAVSPPVHLESCVAVIHKWSNKLYHDRFLKTLLKKVAEKVKQFPDLDPENKRNAIKTLREFDNVFTAPMHGFLNGDDYYAKASALSNLPLLQKDALVITAQDDPMLGNSCYLDHTVSKKLYYFESKHGGHVGFFSGKKEGYLYERLSEYWFSKSLNSLE